MARVLVLVGLALAEVAAAENEPEVTCWPTAPLRLLLPAAATPRCEVVFEAEGTDLEATLAVDLGAPLAAPARAVTRGR